MSKTKFKHRSLCFIAFVLTLALSLTACGKDSDGDSAYTPSGGDLQMDTWYYQDGDSSKYQIIFYADATILLNGLYHGTFEFTGSNTLNVQVPDITSETLLFEIIDEQEIYDSTSDMTYYASNDKVNTAPSNITEADFLIGESTEDEYVYYLYGDKGAGTSLEFTYSSMNINTSTDTSYSSWTTEYTVEGDQISGKMLPEGADELTDYTYTILDQYTLQGENGEQYINIYYNPAFAGTTIQGTFDYSVWYGTFTADDGSTIEFWEETFFEPTPAIAYIMSSNKGEGAYSSGTLLIAVGLNISNDGLTITDDYNEFVLDGDTMYVTAVGSSTNGDDFADTYYR
jgi:hypothetical protein